MKRFRALAIIFLTLVLILSGCQSAKVEQVPEIIVPEATVEEAPKAEVVVEEAPAVIEEKTFSISEDGTLSAEVGDISKYGNIYIYLKTETLLSEGIEPGDVVSVKSGDAELFMPVVTSYADVDVGFPLVKVDGEYVEIAINHGNFKEALGVDLGSVVEIKLSEKGAYKDEYTIRHMERTDNREDYESDEVFANFREIEVGNLADGRLFRSCNPALGDARAPYADKLAQENKITLVVNLADSPESVLEHINEAPYYKSLYEDGRVITLNMAVDFNSEDFLAKFAEGLRFIIENGEGERILIHCNEGKDRAGFVSAILSALAGASMDEIVEDYMTSYENYFHVEKGSEQYELISKIPVDFFIEANGRPFPLVAIKDVTKAYLEYRVGLSADEIAKLESILTN